MLLSLSGLGKLGPSIFQLMLNYWFIATSGIIDRWNTRHGIGMKQVSGEEKSILEKDIRPWLDLTLPSTGFAVSCRLYYNVAS